MHKKKVTRCRFYATLGSAINMRISVWTLLILTLAFLTVPAFAVGSGLNVIVVVNQNSTNSLQLGNDYSEARGVPPQNVFRLTNWTGGSVAWSRTDFETRLLNPLIAMVIGRGLTNQAEVVLLSMDVPYRVVDGDSQNSTTSALFYGFKTNTASPVPGYPTCSLPDYSSNSYAYSELPFRDARPNTAATNSFLAMMLTDTSLTEAELILSRGVAADSSFPTQTVVLQRTSDTARNVRYVEFDNAIFDSRVRGDNSLVRVDSDATSSTNLLGLLTGLANLSLPVNAFVSGAVGDSLTSFGGDILENSGQTSLLAFLNSGAAASYGTVVEPCNYLEKFPDPLDYFYQSRGFSVVEAYYQSVLNPYQGLLVGEPLSSPFARPGTTDWSSLTNGTVLSGQAALNVIFFAATTNLPLGKVDLFVDGTFLQTLTNLPPTPGNDLSVTIGSHTVHYIVPANATVASAANGLAAALNAQSAATGVEAEPKGDRLMLLSTQVTNPASNITLSTGAATGSGAQLTTMLSLAHSSFLESTALGYLGVAVSNGPVVGDWLQLRFTKTNGSIVSVGVTNTTAGTTIGAFFQGLLNQVNSTPALQSADGVLASDFYEYSSIVAAEFTIFARSPGWPAAQIQVTLTGSPNLLTLPSGSNRLEDNLSDLQPRNHLYVASGSTQLLVSSLLDTTKLPDGFHDLTAVANEGDSVRTQTRISRGVRIQNTGLMATLSPLLAGTNATLEMPLQFTVAANVPNISRLELFSTGGSVGVVSNQQSTVFTVPSAALGLGLHPFYAVTTDPSGTQYRTQTAWIRLIPSIQLSIGGAPIKLTWTAIPGRQYDVLATTNLSTPFQPVASVIASNSLAQWPIPVSGGSLAFYRVRLSP
jgi:uncharacterized protein (TIGR03790 family)